MRQNSYQTPFITPDVTDSNKLRRSLKATFCFLLTITPATYLLFNLIYENGLKHYFQYYVKPKDVNALNPPEKLIFLWTPIQGSYKEWSWGIGPDPLISNCGNKLVDGRCLITTDPSLLEKSDVVLFSVQDIKQVLYPMHQDYFSPYYYD